MSSGDGQPFFSLRFSRPGKVYASAAPGTRRVERACSDGPWVLLGTGAATVVKTDIFVVGGGPAGLAAAIAARRRGFHVTVADQVAPPADKACGEGLMPDALLALANLGIPMSASDSFPFRGIRFLDRGVEVAASFPSGSGRGVRRTTLHRMMADYAESIGVKLLWGMRVDLNALSCRWIVGADGENSWVRKTAGLDKRLHDERRFGFRRHYRVEPWTDYMELYWGEAHQVYVTPVTPDSICVVAISRDPRLRLDNALLSFPPLARRLKTNAIIAGERGAVTSSRKLQRVYRDRIALIGDASGSVDAITGEGLCLAFRQAIALAEAIERDDLRRYHTQHRRIARRPEWMARLLLILGDRPAVRRIAMHTMAARPSIFTNLLTVHVGAYDEKNHFLDSLPIDGSCVRAGDGTSS